MSEVSRKRHVTYCQKSTRPKTSREKACASCNKSKTKCDFRHPCLRCKTRQTFCTYDNNNPSLPGHSSTQPAILHESLIELGAPQAEHDFPVSAPIDNSIPNIDAPHVRIDILQGDHEYLGSLSENFTITNNEFPLQTSSIETPANQSISISEPMYPNFELFSPSAFEAFDLDFTHDDLVEGPVKQTWESNSLIAQTPQCPVAIAKANASRRAATGVSERHISFLISILRTYPKLLLKRATLPPFIHPFSYNQHDSEGNVSFPEPLAICKSIAHMFDIRAAEARKFLWRTIDAEIQRLHDEVCTYDSYYSSIVLKHKRTTCGALLFI